jgi:transketolase
MNNKMDWMSVNAIRVLSADAIEKAKSGHPGGGGGGGVCRLAWLRPAMNCGRIT